MLHDLVKMNIAQSSKNGVSGKLMASTHSYISVLLVDDHEIVRSGLKRFLSTDNSIHVVAEASTGSEAVAFAEMYKPDVALIDVNMPIMDGIATTKRIRIVSPKTRIIMLSAHNDSSYFDSAIRAGAQGYLTKEIDIKGLVEALRLVMKGERVFSKGFSESIVTSRGEALKSLPSDIKLTQREQEVLELVVKGLTSIEIAEKLSISSRTVETHRFNLLNKLGVKNTADLVRFALSNS